jgi:hypothetical protein
MIEITRCVSVRDSVNVYRIRFRSDGAVIIEEPDDPWA